MKALLGLFSRAQRLYLKVQNRLSTSQIIAISFLAVISVGAILLYLPFSQQNGQKVIFLDALFTATSAVCVTGLVTLVTATTWSLFGQVVILCLIQIGGLSLVTVLTFVMVYLGKKVTLKARLAVQGAFNVNDLSGMVRMVLFVIRGTFLCEGIGAVVLSVFFMTRKVIWHKAVYYGIFHSVSAFCNAGFDVIGPDSLVPFADSWLLLVTFAILIVSGGIGFSVWRDLVLQLKHRFMPSDKKHVRLSLHVRLAIWMTVLLLAGGSVYFFVMERENPATLGIFPMPIQWLNAFFQSVTLRTAGFASIPQGGLYESSKLASSVLMLIGGSPGGTAGGIKTVTIAILLCAVWSALKGRDQITVFERTIPYQSLQKALTITIMMLSMWAGGALLLSVTEKGSAFTHTYADLLFEVASALGTVGVTTGITPFLSGAGKVLLICCMVIGRIGPITIAISLSSGMNRINERIQYPPEDVLIG